MRLDEHQTRFVKIANKLSYGNSNVMRDFCEMSAIALANSLLKNEEREARYMQIVKAYDREQLGGFAEMLACVVNSLSTGDDFNFHDCLGELHMTEEVTGRSKWDSDVAFTPKEISYLMAQITFSGFKMPEKGYVTLCEPACGGGSTVIAACHALKDLGFNFQKQLHVTAVEIRPMIVHMAYIQFSLLHIPAIVVHGDSLALKTWSVWKTPAHHLGFWDAKLSRNFVATEQQIEQAISFTGQAAFDFTMPAKKETRR